MSDKMEVAVQRRQHRIGAGRFIIRLQIFLKRYNCVFIPFFTRKHQKLSHVPAVFFDCMAAFFLFSQIIPKLFQFILFFLFQCISSLSHEIFSRICFSQLFLLSQLPSLVYFLRTNLIVYARRTKSLTKKQISLDLKTFHIKSL